MHESSSPTSGPGPSGPRTTSPATPLPPHSPPPRLTTFRPRGMANENASYTLVTPDVPRAGHIIPIVTTTPNPLVDDPGLRSHNLAKDLAQQAEDVQSVPEGLDSHVPTPDPLTPEFILPQLPVNSSDGYARASGMLGQNLSHLLNTPIPEAPSTVDRRANERLNSSFASPVEWFNRTHEGCRERLQVSLGETQRVRTVKVGSPTLCANNALYTCHNDRLKILLGTFSQLRRYPLLQNRQLMVATVVVAIEVVVVLGVMVSYHWVS
jgi:hypothetical protein